MQTFYFFKNNTFTINTFLFNNNATIQNCKHYKKKKISAMFFVNEMYGYKEYNNI